MAAPFSSGRPVGVPDVEPDELRPRTSRRLASTRSPIGFQGDRQRQIGVVAEVGEPELRDRRVDAARCGRAGGGAREVAPRRPPRARRPAGRARTCRRGGGPRGARGRPGRSRIACGLVQPADVVDAGVEGRRDAHAGVAGDGCLDPVGPLFAPGVAELRQHRVAAHLGERGRVVDSGPELPRGARRSRKCSLRVRISNWALPTFWAADVALGRHAEKDDVQVHVVRRAQESAGARPRPVPSARGRRSGPG